jgi:long-chain fatty acid transport protein
VGRYYVRESALVTFDLMPSPSYRVNDWLSIGAGLTLQCAALKTKLALNNTIFGSDGQLEYKGDSFGVGGGGGILVEPWKGTRFGLTYLSPVQQEFDDTPDFTNTVSPINQALAARTGTVKIKMTIPQAVMFSVYSELGETWALMGNLGW